MSDITWKDEYGDAEGLACTLDIWGNVLAKQGSYGAATDTRAAATALREQAERIDALEAENKEHIATLKARRAATMRAVAAWRSGVSGRDLVMPDHADLVTWLMDEVGRLTAIIDDSPLDELCGCDCCGATTTDGCEVDGGWQCRACSLEVEIANLRAGDIHSCHAECQRPVCVAGRRIAELEAENERLANSLQRANEHHERLAARLDIRQNEDGSTHDEIDRLRKWQREMVEIQASGGRLDGYRELGAKCAALESQNDRLRAGLQAVADLIAESDGVAGLHLNGDIATWDELRTGGRFEDWLLAFDEAHQRAQAEGESR